MICKPMLATGCTMNSDASVITVALPSDEARRVLRARRMLCGCPLDQDVKLGVGKVEATELHRTNRGRQHRVKCDALIPETHSAVPKDERLEEETTRSDEIDRAWGRV